MQKQMRRGKVNCPRSWTQVLLTPSAVHWWSSDFMLWSPWVFGAGQGKGWGGGGGGQGAEAVFLFLLHARPHLHQDSVTDLFEIFVLLRKYFQRTLSNGTFFSGNWVQALPSLGLPFFYSGREIPALCWRIYSIPRWQHKGRETYWTGLQQVLALG